MVNIHGRFAWYELLTTDMEAAKAFYADVVGWTTKDASQPGLSYTLFTVGETAIGGVTKLPDEAAEFGARPCWVGYVGADDVDDAATRVAELGGTVHVPPTDIPGISRFAVAADPQTATFALVKWSDSGQHPAELDKPGRVGWHELLAADAEKAFAFYNKLFDWRKTRTDVGLLGAYQLFSAGGRIIGGMFTKPPVVPVPFWLYYFNIADIDAAVKRVKAGGGEVLEGPVEVPGGARVARCTDPQGATFALIGAQRDKTVGYFESAAMPDFPAARGRRWSW